MFGDKDKEVFKVLIGRARKGGSLEQQSNVFLQAARDLEAQLNDGTNGVQSIEAVVVHDANPIDAEIISIVKSKVSSTKKKGE